MFEFGERSKSNLETCRIELQQIATKALSYGVADFSVIEGHRNINRQKRLFDEGKSQIDGINKKGKHNKIPSEAVDLLPYPFIINGERAWDDKQRLCVLAGLMYAAAAELGYKIRWGGDWSGNGNNKDSSFDDFVHFEIIFD